MQLPSLLTPHPGILANTSSELTNSGFKKYDFGVFVCFFQKKKKTPKTSACEYRVCLPSQKFLSKIINWYCGAQLPKPYQVLTDNIKCARPSELVWSPHSSGACLSQKGPRKAEHGRRSENSSQGETGSLLPLLPEQVEGAQFPLRACRAAHSLSSQQPLHTLS